LEALRDLARQAPPLDFSAAGFSALSESPRCGATACGELPTGHCLPETGGSATLPQAVLRFSAIPRQAVAHADEAVAKPVVARIGVFRDAAFQFYYPENLEALSREGAVLTEISPLRDAELPEVDALYIGGGFPETLAPALTKNQPFLGSLRRSIAKGLPVYAECGGAVFLGEKLVFHQHEYAMAGVLPVVFAFGSKPQGHGYTLLETVATNPFFSVGDTLRGHEFHYTYVQSTAAKELNFAFRVRRGYGFDGHGDGLCYGNVLASYMHVHALGAECWAPAMVRAAVQFRARG
jgi:cobyrinic acid a,c-diamide synthase